MNIITTIPDEAIPAWQFRVDQYNAGSGLPPITIEGFAQLFRNEETASYVASKTDAEKMAMAANDRLMALGVAVMAQPGKLDVIEAAILPILNA